MTDQLTVSVEAQIQKFEQAMRRASASTNKMVASVERQVNDLQKKLNRRFNFGGLEAALGGLGLAALGNEVIKYSDQWVNAGNRLAAAGIPIAQVGAQLSQLNAIANDARVPLEGVVGLYSRLAAQSESLGVSQSQLLSVTATVSKSLSATGAGAAEVSSVVTQLGQALASGTLQGDELRSLAENSPQLMAQLAKSLGVPIGQLKKLGAAGELTSKRVIAALLGASAEIDKSFDATQSSIGSSLTVLDNSLAEFIGTAGQSSGAASALAGAIRGLADNLPAAAGALGAFITAWLTIASGTAAVAAVRAMVPATVALAVAARGATLSMLGLAPATAATGTAAVGATAAFRALFVALASNPLGAAILAATAVGVAIFAMSDSADDGAAALENYQSAASKAAESSAKFGELTRISAERDVAAATAEIKDQEGALWDLIEARRQAAREEALRDAAAMMDAQAQLGLLGEITQARKDAAEAGQVARSNTLGSVTAMGDAAFQVSPDVAQAEADLRAANAEAQAFAKSMAVIAVPPEVANELARIQTQISAATRAGAFEDAVGLALEAQQTINENTTLSDQAKQQLLADFGEVLEILRQTASAAGIVLPIGADAEGATRKIDQLETEVLTLKDLVDGVSATELRLVTSSNLAELNTALGETTTELDALRDKMRTNLAAAGLGDEAIAEFDRIAQAAISGEITVAEADRRLSEFGTEFNVEGVVGSFSTVITRAIELYDWLRGILAAKGAIENNEPTPLPETPTPTGGGGGGGKSMPYDDAVGRLKAETAETLALAEARRKLDPLSEDYAVQLEALRVEQDLLNSAQKQGVIISPEVAAAIRELAMQSSLAKLELESVEEAQENLATRAEEWRSTLQEASSAFVKDLLAGKSAADALSNALGGIADKLLDLALEQAFAGLFGDGFGVAKGGGFLSKLLGFAEGGYTGNGGKYTPAGVVHKGEYVLDADTTRKIGVKNLDALRANLRGYANGGLVGRPSTPPAALPGYAMGGLVGAPQMPIVPQQVTRAAAAPQSGGTTVNVINSSGADVQQSRRSEGGRDYVDVFVGEVRNQISQGKFDRTLASRFGVQPKLIGR